MNDQRPRECEAVLTESVQYYLARPKESQTALVCKQILDGRLSSQPATTSPCAECANPCAVAFVLETPTRTQRSPKLIKDASDVNRVCGGQKLTT